MKYQNPVLSGFHPDPSICRVEDDFYLVTSTFEFFPGVPIYHSKNLVNWELINYCLTTDTQLPLHNCNASGGIYAPTIRYHEGTFFMVTTNVTDKGNFIVHTKDIRGLWSEPAWVKQRGIDPSLFWDEDGTCYFVSNSDDKGNHGIALCKIDPFTGEMKSPSVVISKGCGGRNNSPGKYPEAPHIYKRDGWYYLMMAEGGTEYGHTETIQRSRNIWGPYEQGGPYQPMLTHRDGCNDPLSAAIDATGHADIVDDQNGKWWLVCLGIRPIKGMFLHNLGRETFLSPIVWTEDGWPVVGNKGRISLQMDGPLPGPVPQPVNRGFIDDFDGEILDLHWNFVRNPERERYHLHDSRITICGGTIGLSVPNGHPTMIAIRQPEFCVTAKAIMDGEIVQNQKSGLSVFYNSFTHYDIFITREDDGYYICLRKTLYDLDIVTVSHRLEYSGRIGLKVESDKRWYYFSYEQNGEWIELGKGMTAPLCKETQYSMTFTGTYIGLFSENGTISFDEFALLTQ